MNISWTEQAVSDLESTFNFLYERSPKGAARVIQNILEGVEALASYPQIGREGRVPGTRELVIGRTPFIVIYRLQPDQVQVLSVLHAARKWP